MKQLIFLIFMLLMGKVAFAQTDNVAQSVRAAFEGTWQLKERYFTNTLKIQFEPGKDYALFTDIGTGEAPPYTFKVQIKGNTLILPAVRDLNDYLEMEVIRGKLRMRSQSAEWDEQGNIKAYGQTQQRFFKKLKQ